MTILVVGLGLIGGSLAKALAQCTGHEIWGLDRDSLAVQAALEEGTWARRTLPWYACIRGIRSIS